MPRSPSPQPSDAAIAEAKRGAGVWSLAGGELVALERFDLGPAIVLVPSESVLLLTVDLPIQGQRRRAEALPFAIEDRIAEPLGAAHIALGAEIAPHAYLAGIVSHAVMQGWMATLVAAGLGHARIIPDALALPVPQAGFWSVDLAGDRALVRTGDGAGFALPAAHLPAAWAAAGQPRCIAYGEPLPAAMAGDPNHHDSVPAEPVEAPSFSSSEQEERPFDRLRANGSLGTLGARLADPPLDLRQGVYAAPRAGLPTLARRIALVAAFGLIAHGAIAAADTLALDHIAAKRAADTRALLAQIAPDAPIGPDVAASAADILPESGSGPSRFLSLMARVGGALKQLGPAVSLRSVAFDASADTLMLQLETGDMAGLQRVPQAIGAQGLSAEPGAASINQGKAVGSFLIRSGS